MPPIHPRHVKVVRRRLGQVDGDGVRDVVARDCARPLIDRVRQLLGRRPPIVAVVLDAKVFCGAARVVGGGEDEGAARAAALARAQDGRDGGGGEEATHPDPHGAHSVGGGHADDDVDGGGGVVAAVAGDDEGLAWGEEVGVRGCPVLVVAPLLSSSPFLLSPFSSSPSESNVACTKLAR